MMRIAALLALCLIAAGPAIAQTKSNDDIVREIRDDYAAIGAKIETVRKGGDAAKRARIVLSELVVNKGGHDWPAVGIHRVVYRFWYEWAPDQPFPTRLRKVEVDTTSSARKFYQEYFYGEDGRLLFYLERADGAGAKGVRSYYSGEKLVRMVSGDTVNDTPTPGERTTAVTIIRAAQRIMGTFRAALGLRGN
jgi:hypothetical protein